MEFSVRQRYLSRSKFIVCMREHHRLFSNTAYFENVVSMYDFSEPFVWWMFSISDLVFCMELIVTAEMLSGGDEFKSKKRLQVFRKTIK